MMNLMILAQAESNEGTWTLLLYLGAAVLFILGLKQLRRRARLDEATCSQALEC